MKGCRRLGAYPLPPAVAIAATRPAAPSAGIRRPRQPSACHVADLLVPVVSLAALASANPVSLRTSWASSAATYAERRPHPVTCRLQPRLSRFLANYSAEDIIPSTSASIKKAKQRTCCCRGLLALRPFLSFSYSFPFTPDA
ncbi:unnamed protein product [Urochloa humidicola]